MIDDREREALIEAVAGAWRPRDAEGTILAHPAWHDLDEAARAEAFEVALAERWMEATLDAGGLSATARLVLGRIGPAR